MALPVIFAQRGYLNFLTAAWRLDKFTIADIDANVVGGTATLRAEEDQITVFQFATFNRRFQLAGDTLIKREVNRFHYGLLFSSQYGYLLQSIIVLFWLPS